MARVNVELPLVVLAGGFGTRLREVVSNVPKPLAPVAGQPFLAHLLRHWISQGVRHFVFSLYHQAPLICEFLDQQFAQRPGIRIATVIEPLPLGTGGGVAYALEQAKLRGPFLVANADTWVGGGLAELAAGRAPTIGVMQVPNTERYGSVGVDGGRISSFREKQDCAGPGLINAGTYLLHPGHFAGRSGSAFSLELDVFPELVRRRELLAQPMDGSFIDIGIPTDYTRFCRWIESEMKCPL
jgi:NDP-sugar pyrophosphorylase family protein